MGKPAKIHERSINRGVNGVLAPKPMRESFAVTIGTMPNSAGRAEE